MFSIEEYNHLASKYGQFASWAIWDYKKPNDTSIIDQFRNQLNSRFVLTALNMSRQLNRPDWFNFHDNTHARKIKFACNDTKLRGSYMTDLFKDMIDPDSINFRKSVTKEKIDSNVELFNQEMLDIKINKETQFVVFGDSARFYFDKYFKEKYKNHVVYCKHYSSRGTDREWVERFWDKLDINQNFDLIMEKYKK